MATEDKPSPAVNQGCSTKSIVGFVLAFIVPPVGAVISLIARRDIKRSSLHGKGLTTFGIAWGILFTPFFLLMVLLFLMFNGWDSLVHGNAAQKASKPFIAKIERAGGKKICDNGDDGYGIDNNQPWYQAYYQIPDRSGLTRQIESFAGQSGYTLRTDTAEIGYLKGNSTRALGFTDQEQFNPKADYLAGSNGADKLKLVINRDTSVPLYCNQVRPWGQKRPAENGIVIIDISFTAPDTR